MVRLKIIVSVGQNNKGNKWNTNMNTGPGWRLVYLEQHFAREDIEVSSTKMLPELLMFSRYQD